MTLRVYLVWWSIWGGAKFPPTFSHFPAGENIKSPYQTKPSLSFTRHKQYDPTLSTQRGPRCENNSLRGRK